MAKDALNATSHDQNFKILILDYPRQALAFFAPEEASLCVLPDIPYEHWQDSDNLVARLNLPNMRYPRAEKVHAYARAMRGLLDLEPDWRKQVKYIDFIDIYSKLTDNEQQLYHQQPTGALGRKRAGCAHAG